VYSTEYNPLRKDDLIRLLRKVGFRKMNLYEDYQFKKYDTDESYGLIVVCKKGAAESSVGGNTRQVHSSEPRFARRNSRPKVRLNDSSNRRIAPRISRCHSHGLQNGRKLTILTYSRHNP